MILDVAAREHARNVGLSPVVTEEVTTLVDL
jgi:hypothetical protein